MYSATFGLSGDYGINGPTLPISRHLVVVLVEVDALWCPSKIARVSGHRRAGFSTGQYAWGRCDTFANGSLNRLRSRNPHARNPGQCRMKWTHSIHFSSISSVSLRVGPQQNDAIAIIQSDRGRREAVVHCRVLSSRDVFEAGVPRGAYES